KPVPFKPFSSQTIPKNNLTLSTFQFGLPRCAQASLRQLGLCSNQLVSFPLEILLFRRLECLDLRGCIFDSDLPAELHTLRNLRVLRIDSQCLPAAIQATLSAVSAHDAAASERQAETVTSRLLAHL